MHHPCHGCGLDLTRLRALPDTHYGLPVVTCPSCGTSVVRRRDPGVAGWRRARRTVGALWTVFVQGVVFALCSLAALFSIRAVSASAYHDHGDNPLRVLLLSPDSFHPDAEGPFLLIVTGAMLLLGLFSGVWIRSALSHNRAWAAWLVWSAAPLVLALIPVGAYHAWHAAGRPGTPWASIDHARRVTHTLTAGLMYAAFVPFGFPLGRTARDAWRARATLRHGRIRRRRRRLREDR